jgi:RNA polymerase sigma-70 factor, ECF subfamily
MRSRSTEVAEFLAGAPGRVAAIRAAIEVVVRSFRLTGDGLERDLVQEVLSRVIRNLSAGQFRGESTLETYVQKVARYACLEHLRRRRFEVRMNLDSIPSGARWSEPEAALLMDEEHRRNLRAFAALSAESRELLRLIFLEGLSYADIADRLGLTEGAIKSRVHRIRLACREAAAVPRGFDVRRSEDEAGG